ncbi:MAG TPA: RICIN domain-containing protein [Acidothermaceae bacterium]|jgi:Tfp pilus assembly protein PilX
MQSRDTVMQRVMQRIARQADDREGGVAMLLALMVILLVLTISIAVAGVTLSQVKPTQLDRKTVVTEDAAEAGFDVALNRVRAAASGTTTNSSGQTVPAGSRALLPCGPVTGSVNGGASSDSTYNVTLAYYTTDPTGQSASWLASNKIQCVSSPATVPGFVALNSTGGAPTIPGTRVNSGDRVISTVYALSTTNQNIAGGNIPFYANLSLCFAVNDATAVKTGDGITVATCNPIAPQQKWSYTANLQLQIVATDGTLQCMQAVNTQYTVVALAPCSTNLLPPASPYTPYQQIWSYNDGGQFQNSKTDDSGLGSYCLNLYTGTPGSAGNPAALAAGDLVDLDVCGSQMVPTASVGAGAAGTALRPFQLVNYLNFGRCIDDTNQQVNATWLIGYPCKQDPLATNLTWNQKYYTGISGGTAGSGATAAYGGSGGNTVIATTTPTVTGCQVSNTQPCQFISFPNGAGGASTQYYCLEAGASATPAAPVDGTIVTVQPCNTADNYQLWTYTSNLVSSYANQYLIQPYGAATSNLCLSMTIGSTPPGLTYSGGGGAPIPAYGYISLQTCTGTAWQKWNAPPNPQSNAQKNTFEVPNP